MSDQIKEISDFLSNEGHRDLTDEQIEAYIKVGTYIIARTNNRIIALCLFSVHYEIAYVHEVVVNKQDRFKKILKWLAIEGLNKFPFLKEVVFKRDRKYPDREPSKYDIYKLIGINKKAGV